MKKKNVNKEQLKEWWKKPRSKALVFFIVYFFFFLIIGLNFNGNQNTQTPNQDTNKPNEEESISDTIYQFSNIKNNNYHYVYKIELDNVLTTFEGNRNNTKESFVVKTKDEEKEYFNNDGIFLAKDEEWSLEDTPYLYQEFYDISKIEELINQSTLISKTEYQNQEKAYHYQIPTSTMVSILEKSNIELIEEANGIIVYIKDNEVYQVELNLSSYASYKENTDKHLKMILTYSLFGTIEELEIPKYKIN